MFLGIYHFSNVDTIFWMPHEIRKLFETYFKTLNMRTLNAWQGQFTVLYFISSFFFFFTSFSFYHFHLCLKMWFVILFFSFLNVFLNNAIPAEWIQKVSVVSNYVVPLSLTNDSICFPIEDEFQFLNRNDTDRFNIYINTYCRLFNFSSPSSLSISVINCVFFCRPVFLHMMNFAFSLSSSQSLSPLFFTLNPSDTFIIFIYHLFHNIFCRPSFLSRF